MAGALQIIELSPMPLINILQLPPIGLIKILMQITVLLKPVSNQNKLSFSLKHVFQNLFPSIKYSTTIKEIVNITMSFKSPNSCGYDEVPTKLLKLCSHFISSPLNYISNMTLFTGPPPEWGSLQCKASLRTKE